MFPRAQEHAANMLGLMPVWYARGVNIAPRSISCRLEKIMALSDRLVNGVVLPEDASEFCLVQVGEQCA